MSNSTFILLLKDFTYGLNTKENKGLSIDKNFAYWLRSERELCSDIPNPPTINKTFKFEGEPNTEK